MLAKLSPYTAGLLLILSACQPQRPTASTPPVSAPTVGTMATSQPDARLNDIWVLRQLNGNTIDTTGLGRRAPYMELHLIEKKVMGHTGCNAFDGTFSTMGRSLHFMPISIIRSACPGATTETEMLGVLQVIDMFQIGDNQLRLYRANREMAVFQKVD
jgi:heat shock protein HslJ